jgi:hypothetical protein
METIIKVTCMIGGFANLCFPKNGQQEVTALFGLKSPIRLFNVYCYCLLISNFCYMYIIFPIILFQF